MSRLALAVLALVAALAGGAAPRCATAASSGLQSDAIQTTAALPSSGARAVVLDSRVGLHSEVTRFVLELTEEVSFRITAADTRRITVEFSGLTAAASAQPVAGRGLVLRYRYATVEPDGLRLVLETAGPARVREAYMLPARDGHRPRLVLDLERASRSEVDSEALAALVRAQPAPPPPLVAPQAPQAAVLPTASPLLAPLPPATPPRPPTAPEKPLIVVDPGHGGVDPGAVGIGGVFEKDITLATARELRRQLEATGRYRVRLTRDADTFIPLRDRVAIAREAGAALFVSLHADSIGSNAIRGLSVYTLSDKASDREAEALAAKENRVDAIAGINLASETDQVASILIDLAQRDTMNQSRRFATMALDHLGREVRILPNRPHRQAGFAVLTAPDVPSILVEMGYLSSKEDANLLTTPAHRERLSRALSRGIDSYFKWLAGVRRS